MDGSVTEKELAELELVDQSRESLRQTLDQLHDQTSSILRFTLQWEEVEEHFGSARMSLETRAKEVEAVEESVRRRLSEVEAREKELGLLRKAIKVELIELEKQRESDLKQALEESVWEWVWELQKKEELLSTFEAREKELNSLHESINEKLSELEKKEKEFDLKQKQEIEKTRKEFELMEKRLEHLDSVQKSADEKLKELERKGKELESVKKSTEDRFNSLNDVDTTEKSVRQRASEVEAIEKELGVLQESIKGKLSELEKDREFDLKQRLEESVWEWNLDLLKKEVLLTKLEPREKELGLLRESKSEDKKREFKLKERKLEEWAKQLELKERELREKSRKELIRPQKKSRLELRKRRADDSLNAPAKKQKSLRESNEFRKNKPSQRCEGNGKKAVQSSEVEELDNDCEANGSHESLHCLDPEFNNFDKTMSCFAVNQVWAMYDDHDDMPRFYALIRKVLAYRNKLQVTWLESLMATQDEESIPVACGEFEYGETEEQEGHLMFSHQMHHIRSGKNVLIYPKKGEIWALFRDWDNSWRTDPGKHKPPYKYDFVEVIHNLNENFGVGVAYLGRVNGFVSVFERAEQHGVAAIFIPPGEMQRFSHRVPSVRMTGKEKEGVPCGSFELDPAALPNHIFELDRRTNDAEMVRSRQGVC